jgi:hypothetical protein
MIATKILEYPNMKENDCVTAGAETQVQHSFATHFSSYSQAPAWECLQYIKFLLPEII